jgi:hypothetical protein
MVYEKRLVWISAGTRAILTKVLSGRAIAQAVSRWLPTAAARVRARVWSCGICGGQNGAGAGFLGVLRFPLPIFIPPIAPQSPSSIIWGLYNRPEMAAVSGGLSPTLPMMKKRFCLIAFLSLRKWRDSTWDKPRLFCFSHPFQFFVH